MNPALLHTPLIFEKSRPGRRGASLPVSDVPPSPAADRIPGNLRRETPAELPEVSELDLVRHFVRLSQKNFSIDTTFYPLGSCTMKLNPKVHEKVAAMPGFARVHPYQPEETVQGMLEVLWRLERALAEIGGMDEVTLQPAAGAHGELTGLFLIRSHFAATGETGRTKVLIPDSAHGTNPASCTLGGLKAVKIASGKDGLVDLDALKAALKPDVAAIMITNPNTLGLFEERIAEIADLLHRNGSLVYMDGANLNAILGRARPGDFGVDVFHFNLHKTFTTPHGGGGPGAGPVGVKKILAPYLPVPSVLKDGDRYRLDFDRPQTIGRMRAFFGNVGILVRAYTYILSLGPVGLRRVSENAVLNANYLRSRLRDAFPIPHDRLCMHEFVLSGLKAKGKDGHRPHTIDLAKRLLDYGFHSPTIYFPLIVHEAIMIEPTETESRETLDAFADAMLAIAREAVETPEKLLEAPHTLPIRRPDEVRAARQPVLRWVPAGRNVGASESRSV